MLGGLLFVVCIVLQFRYHDPIPWYIWLVALVAMCFVRRASYVEEGLSVRVWREPFRNTFASGLRVRLP